MEPREAAAARYRFKIEHARLVERILQWLGWMVVVLGTLSLAVLVGLWMVGRLTGGQALAASLGTTVGRFCRGPPRTGAA